MILNKRRKTQTPIDHDKWCYELENNEWATL